MNRFTKILLTVVLLAALTSAALWIVGGKKSQYKTQLVIDAPASAVFSYLTEGDKLKQWVTGLTEIESTSQSFDEIGARMSVVFREGDRQFRFDDSVLRYEENKFLSIQSKNNISSTTSIYALEEQDGKTQLDFSVKKSRLGFGRMLAIFSSDDVQNRMEQDTQRLKNLVETNYGNGQ